MADSKLSALTAETAPVGADLVYLVDDVAGTPTSKKATLTDVAASAPFSGVYAPLAVRDLHFTKPVNGTSRTSTTLGSLGTAWNDSVTVAAGEDVEYDIAVSWQCGTQPTVYVALAVDGTIVDRVRSVSGGNDAETRLELGGVVTGLSAGAHTFEVFLAASSAVQVFVASVADTSTSVAANQDGVSSMRLRIVNAI